MAEQGIEKGWLEMGRKQREGKRERRKRRDYAGKRWRRWGVSSGRVNQERKREMKGEKEE